MLYLDYLGKVGAENEPIVKTKQCVHGVEEEPGVIASTPERRQKAPDRTLRKPALTIAAGQGTTPARSSSQSTSLQPEELGSAPTALMKALDKNSVT
ncbi:hypothetical protein L914_19776 [Phytophthora nicotianae]|uniref:Uncharacterized protein n=1 Tax=Phytophthora nicotianae TaxID=4792 RepID=W2M962_PHYNI|nr:hypothetical protein L914_19776 [Phytophthora nicotianae]